MKRLKRQNLTFLEPVTACIYSGSGQQKARYSIIPHGEEIKEKGGKHSYRLMKGVEVEKIRSKISQFAPFDEDQTFREKVVYEQKMIGMFDNLSIELLRNLLLLRKTSIPVTPRTTSSC